MGPERYRLISATIAKWVPRQDFVPLCPATVPSSTPPWLQDGDGGSFNPANENHVIAVGKAIHHQALAVGRQIEAVD